MMKSYLTRPDP